MYFLLVFTDCYRLRFIHNTHFWNHFSQAVDIMKHHLDTFYVSHLNTLCILCEDFLT